jgi:hypothetical protein
MKTHALIPKTLVAISMCLYAIALFVPAIQLTWADGSPNQNVDQAGWVCLTFGIIFFPAWLANPFLFVGWYRILKRRQKAVGVSVCSLVISAGFMIYCLSCGKSAPVYVGGWLWLVSIALTALAAVLARLDSPAQ